MLPEKEKICRKEACQRKKIFAKIFGEKNRKR
jgi:hypothetical protein